MKIINSYSPNFDTKKRSLNSIKLIVIHYTGMQSERESLIRLCDLKSKVSSHYFIKGNGKVLKLVEDHFVAWHAGKSYWKNFKFLNKNSIGIEISNPGHQFNYKKFSQKQIKSVIQLTKYLKLKYKINSKNILGHSDIAPSRKKDPGEKFPWELLSKYNIGVWHSLDKKIIKSCRQKSTNNIEKKLFFSYLIEIGYFFKKKNTNSILSVVKAFQRRFRPDLINGKIDVECLKIAKNLVKSGFN